MLPCARRADQRLGLFEWTLHHILLRHLRPQFEAVRPPQIVYYGLQQLGEQCSVLLSALARASQHDDDAAFEAGARQIPEAKLRLLPQEACGLNALDKALHDLAQVVPKQRARLVDACASCICADAAVNVDGVRAAAGDLRHARLPDAAACCWAGGIDFALRSTASEQRVVKPQPSHEPFAPSASLAALRQRAALLRSLRAFFDERGFFEVETPLLAKEIIPELHIEPIRAANGEFLQASPELHMKRLVAAGATAIFQVTRSFRQDERGPLHNPEFTIVEWYRVGDDLQAGIDLLDEFVQTLLPHRQRRARRMPRPSYGRWILIHTPRRSLNWPRRRTRPGSACRVECRPTIATNGSICCWPRALSRTSAATDRKSCTTIRRRKPRWPKLPRRTQAVKSPNASSSITAASSWRTAFTNSATRPSCAAVSKRLTLPASPMAAVPLPLPESLLAALEHGLPTCTGCALGFDRLAMLAARSGTISDVITFR